MNATDATAVIRPAKSADIPAMLKLAETTLHSAQWPAEKYQDIFNPEAPRRLALVLEEAGIICGFLVALCAGVEWELESIAVIRKQQRRGFGTLLLSRFLAIARQENAVSVLLEVRESNLGARRLYEKSGFRTMGTRPHYYQQPSENAVIYRLSSG